MLSEEENEKISKFLSFVLRHKPDEIGLILDNNAWADINELIEKSNANGVNLSMDTLRHVINSSKKQRFAFNEDQTKVRANQGHSLPVDLNLTPITPPEILYHGTADRFLNSIFKKGLLKQDRQHVHLSTDYSTALNVGQRHGKAVVLEIQAGKMYRKGHHFYLSENKVWLTDFVATEYITLAQ